MPHIHTDPGQYDFTASAFIVRTDLAEPKIFLHKHLLSGKWAQPGGHVELDESPWSAVLHEVLEESGYTSNQLKILQPRVRIRDLGTDAMLLPEIVCSMVYELAAHKDHFHTDLIYAFIATGDPEDELLEYESVEVTYFSRSDIVALPSAEISDNVRQVALFILDECLSTWEAVSVEEYL